MKIIVKHSTIAKITKITKNMDSLLGLSNSEHYADPVAEFNSVRNNKIFKVLGKAARFSNDPKAKEMSLEVNPALVEDVLSAAEAFTTVMIPAVKIYHDRLECILAKYKLK